MNMTLVGCRSPKHWISHLGGGVTASWVSLLIVTGEQTAGGAEPAHRITPRSSADCAYSVTGTVGSSHVLGDSAGVEGRP